MRRLAAAFALFVISLAPFGSAQVPAVVRGRVVAADTGDPLRNARVVVKSTREFPPLLTDGDGRFSVALAEGPCTFAVAKPGYAKTTLTVHVPVDTVTVTMPRGAVISGTVMDDRGDPVIGASVIIESAPASGSRNVIASPMTDDLGEYRAGGLAAGQVVVSVFGAPSDVRMMGSAGDVMISVSGRGDPQQRLYFPGSERIADAAIFSLRPGDEKTGVSFTVNAASLGLRIQTPPSSERDAADKSSAVISGQVLRPGGRPLAGAMVQLSPTASTMAPPKLAFTDAEGAYQFILPKEAAGTYRLAANGQNRGYLNTVYGQRRASDPGEEIVITSGETRDHLVMTLLRPAAIAGRVFDENGDPVDGVALRASQVRYIDGRRRLVDMARFAQPTDDLGRYRLFGLQPGEYFVSAAVGQIDVRTPFVDLPGYGTTYFPGTPNTSEAQRVVVGRSQDVLGVDFPIARVKTARVSGRAVDSKGDAITGGIAMIPSRRSGAVVATQMGAKIGRDGHFEFPNVPPGDYVLQASRNRSSGWNEGESSSQFVTVNGSDVTDLEVRTSTGSTLSGKVVLEGSGVFNAGQLNVSPVPVDSDLSPLFSGGPATATVDEDLRFHFAGLSGPRRLQVTRMPPGWTVLTVLLNGIDVTDTPLPFGKTEQSLDDLEVVLSQRVTHVSGRVTASGRPAAASILFFAADRQAWYPQSRFFRRAMSSADGTFRVEGLPAGEYLAAAVAAVSDVRVGDSWQDPDYLETLTARARRMTLSEGGSASFTLTVVAR
jgi:protocatechuate 3,4-dioxygenase beta subunit